MKNYLIGALIIVTLFLGWSAFQYGGSSVGGGFSAYDCSVATSSAVTIGHQESLTVDPAHSRRAWTIVQQPTNATNTVALSFNEGAAAVLENGFQLGETATSTSHADYITFGLNTEFSYTGAVTALTDSGTTTVQVTTCIYNR